MRIWDCHCHLQGDETGAYVLEQMDAAGVERVNLFSRYPGRGRSESEPVTQAEVREVIDHVASVQSVDPARIYGLVFANPRAEGVIEEVERGITDLGLRGVKMIPDHWSPCDDLVMPFYALVRGRIPARIRSSPGTAFLAKKKVQKTRCPIGIQQ